jgi:hypothetical protein
MKIALSVKEGYERISRRTDGGSSAMVASKSQTRPLRTTDHINKSGVAKLAITSPASRGRVPSQRHVLRCARGANQ